MGGGHVTRPNYNINEVDPRDPMAEFYLIAQEAISRAESIALPGAWVRFKPPAGQRLTRQTVREYCAFAWQEQPGYREIFAPGKLQINYANLSADHTGRPRAITIAPFGRRQIVAVQLVPPFAIPDYAAPEVPEHTALLQIQLTLADFDLADRSPAALGRQMVESLAGKSWADHPQIDRWLEKAASVKW